MGCGGCCALQLGREGWAMKADDEALVALAEQARRGAYAPYSNFHVGAALRCRDGRVYTGANVENASYGATCCAERVALFKAVTDGVREFEAIAVASDGRGPTYPCGICRQALAEFSPGMDVVCAGADGAREAHRLSELLPCAFTRRGAGSGIGRGKPGDRERRGASGSRAIN